jgi:hypothetical protein
MLKKITETTASAGLGNPSSKKLFKVQEGEYAGRLAALIQVTASEIAFTWADSPYKTWFSPVNVADDAANMPFDAGMDEEGNVWLVYIEQSTLYLVCRKLTFASGSWTAGNKTYVYNGAASLQPSLTIEPSGKLWLSWAVVSAGYYDIQVKSSEDGGLTWGTGPADAGDVIDAGLDAGHCRIAITPGLIYVIYSGTGTDLMACSRPRVSGGEWSSAFTIASGTQMDEHFDAAVSDDGLLGVVFDSGQLRYREFDGSNWGSVVTVYDGEGLCPQILFSGNVPVITYLTELADGQTLVKYTHRRTGTFSVPEILDSRSGFFEGVVLYDSMSSSYADDTEAAADDTVADVVHPSSGCVVKAAGDILYAGMASPFRLLSLTLSIPGVGGNVSYAYFDGSNWKTFAPAGGNFNLDTSQKSLTLWEDIAGVPDDWQTAIVNGVMKFWIKIEVVSAFSTGPVGSKLTAVSNNNAISCGR